MAGNEPTRFPVVEDNLHHDTLLIQTTFDLGNGSFIMVAQNVQETFEGLRLYHYRFEADSAVNMLAISSPAYDSWTMLPSFFRTDSSRGGPIWVLANFGERESWGQKVMLFDGDFKDAGFMDVALPERMMEDDTMRLKRRDISARIRYTARNDTAYFRFACDSVYLYDDQADRYDIVVPARSVHYTFHPVTGFELWVDGQRRTKAPEGT